MQYRLNAVVRADATQQREELGRFLQFAKQLTVRFVVVAPPYKNARQTLCILDVPDKFTEQAQRVVRIMTVAEDALTQVSGVAPRPEWTVKQTLIPGDGAQPLDGHLLAACASAYLAVTYTSERCWAEIAYCPDDGSLAKQIAAAGWTIGKKASGLRQVFARTKTSLFPSLAQVPAEAPVVVAQVQDTVSILARAPRDDGAAEHAPDAALPLADARAPGLALGVTLDGHACRLALRAQRVVVAVSAADQPAVLPILMRRGLDDGMGVLAIVPRATLDAPILQAVVARVRVLDADNMWESAAIRWEDLPDAQLAAALGTIGVTLPIPEPLPTPLGALLDAVGAPDYCTPTILGLTASPGDDLRGVLAVGGGVVLVDVHEHAQPLLAALLQAHIAHPSLPARPLLVIAPASLALADAVAAHAIHVAYQHPDRTRLPHRDLTLTRGSAGWTLTGMPGTRPVQLQADLLAEPYVADDPRYQAVIDGLAGDADARAPETADWWERPSADGMPDVAPEDAAMLDALYAPEAVAPSVPAGGSIAAWALSGDPLALLAPPAAEKVPDQDMLVSDGLSAREPDDGVFAADTADLAPDTAHAPDVAYVPGVDADAEPLSVAMADVPAGDASEPDSSTVSALNPDALEALPAWDTVGTSADDAAIDASEMVVLNDSERDIAPDAENIPFSWNDAIDDLVVPVHRRRLPLHYRRPRRAGSFEGVELLAETEVEADLLPALTREWDVDLAALDEEPLPETDVFAVSAVSTLGDDARDIPAVLDVSSSQRGDRDDFFSDARAALLAGDTTPFPAASSADTFPALAPLDALDAADPLPVREVPVRADDHDVGFPAADVPPALFLEEPIKEAVAIVPDTADAPGWLPETTAPHSLTDETVVPVVTARELAPPASGAVFDHGEIAIVTPAAERLAERPAVASPVPAARPAALWSSPLAAAQVAQPWDDQAARIAWHHGTPLRDLVAQYHAVHRACTMLQAQRHVRSLVRDSAPTATGRNAPPRTVPVVHALPTTDATPDAMLWDAWQRNIPVDTMLMDLCGQKRGSGADAARDQIYRVVIPRVVRELRADDLVQMLLTQGHVDSAQCEAESWLLQRVARTETPPMGGIADTARRWVITIMQRQSSPAVLVPEAR